MELNIPLIYKKIRCDNYEFISFDIFDTLIRRAVDTPSDVFELVEKYCRSHQIPVEDGFREKRRSAELTALEKNDGPCTFEEIYETYQSLYGGGTDQYQEIEKMLEREVCFPNPEMVSLFQRCVQEGKYVCITSDMYFDADFLSSLLEKCGVTGYQRLFVSCEYRASKSRGTLFPMVLRELGISPGQLLHIGDNWKSDGVRPRLLGIHTFVLPKKPCRYPDKVIEIKDSVEFHMTSRISEFASEDLDEIGALGARTLGPLLGGFSRWLIDRFREEGIQNVYFLARDGYIMQKAFQYLSSNINAQYLYISRRALTVPIIWAHSEYEELFNYIPPFHGYTTVGNFLIRIGLNPALYEREIASCGLVSDDAFLTESLPSCNRLKKLYQILKPIIVKNSLEEYQALCAYFKEHLADGKIAIVDVGYKGTIQNALQIFASVSGRNLDIRGYYLGLNSNALLIKSKAVVAESYLYGPGHSPEIHEIAASFIAIYEAVLLAPHGSLVRFAFTEEGLKPVLAPYEYESDSKCLTDEKSILSSFQKGALQYIKTASQLLSLGVMGRDEYAAFDCYALTALRPDRWVADLFGPFRHFDTYVVNVAQPKPLRHYMLHPRDLKKDFVDSPWKIGFMRRLFRLPLPYDRLYFFMKDCYLQRQREKLKKGIKGETKLS